MLLRRGGPVHEEPCRRSEGLECAEGIVHPGRVARSEGKSNLVCGAERGQVGNLSQNWPEDSIEIWCVGEGVQKNTIHYELAGKSVARNFSDRSKI